MNLCDFVPENIRSIQPYQPGKPISELAREMGLDESSIIKLASNENPLGVSPLALDAMMTSMQNVALYPDGSGFELKSALSRCHDVTPEQIVLGNGSNDVLDLVARIFLKPGASAIYSQHAFAVYPLVVQISGANGIKVPARDYRHDLPAMLDAIQPETRMIFIANPNNPTGTLSSAEDLYQFIERVSRDILIVLDEAYYEYFAETNKSNSIQWLQEFPNLVVTRTFSKIYGLAGVRVGFAIAHPDVANLMNRVRQPFNVSSIGLIGALAALDDNEFIQKSYALNRVGMLQLSDGFRKLGLEFIPSSGNFISFRVSDHATHTPKVYQSLLRQGVIVRPLGIYEMPHHLRVTIGLAAENERFLNTLAQSLGELS